VTLSTGDGMCFQCIDRFRISLSFLSTGRKKKGERKTVKEREINREGNREGEREE
jgi:hypothetical protein